MLAILSSLLILAGLTPRQDVYLIKQIIPEAATVLVLSENPKGNDAVAQYIVASPPYGITIVPVKISSLRKASDQLTGALKRYQPQVVILTEEKTFEDAMVLRLIISQTLTEGVTVLVKNDAQVSMGATFSFSTQEDGKIQILYNKISTEKLKIDLPEKEIFILKEATK